eukprot:c14373_g1_i3.p1 GENE.c14373_g1_i3~~c14373_g1_i3.p1  ORF type:complete len:412 (+),score=122.05 c14373_g1_i3:208-1443(+)
MGRSRSMTEAEMDNNEIDHEIGNDMDDEIEEELVASRGSSNNNKDEEDDGESDASEVEERPKKLKKKSSEVVRAKPSKKRKAPRDESSSSEEEEEEESKPSAKKTRKASEEPRRAERLSRQDESDNEEEEEEERAQKQQHAIQEEQLLLTVAPPTSRLPVPASAKSSARTTAAKQSLEQPTFESFATPKRKDGEGRPTKEKQASKENQKAARQPHSDQEERGEEAEDDRPKTPEQIKQPKMPEPVASPCTQLQRAKELICEGKEAEKEGRISDALKLMTQAGRLVPDNEKLKKKIQKLSGMMESEPSKKRTPLQPINTNTLAEEEDDDEGTKRSSRAKSKQLKRHTMESLLDELNSGSLKALQQLSQVGKKRAESIIAHRSTNQFTKISDLKDIGMSSKMLEKFCEDNLEQ